MQLAENIEDLSREDLLRLLKNYAKNWLAHDGCWFLSVEEKHGIDEAIDIDRESWRKFTVVEAKRIMEFLNLPENCSIKDLSRALKFRLYSTINEDKIEWQNSNTFIYYIKNCRVQQARRRKGFTDFPCKSVGIVEYSFFAKTMNENIKTECLSCPPDITNKDYYCIWRFTLED